MIQTNRTLLIEEIAPDKENIISTIRYIENRESLSDTEVDEIHNKLEVSSFDEVIQKFNPKIFMLINTNTLENAFYRKQPTETLYTLKEIPLCENMAFFDELIELMENKRKRKYVLTSFQEFSSRLLVTPEPEKFWEMREEIIKAVNTQNENQAKRILDTLIQQYDDPLFLLKTFLAEAYSYISEAISGKDDLCFVIEDKRAQVYPIQISDHFRYNKYHTEEEEEMYFKFLNKYIEDYNINNHNLLILLLELCCKLKRKNLELLEKYYREYLDFYKKVLQNFWWETKPLLETLLGIKKFFSQYTQKSDGIPPLMVITNCTPELLADNKYSKTFSLYLETVNEKNYLDKTIWYAIMPRIPFKGGRKENIRERFISNKSDYVYKANTLESVQVVTEILGKYKVQTFFSTITGKDTGFNSLKKNGIEDFESSFIFLENEEKNEYMIPTYPNFTVIPQEYTLMILGEKTKYEVLDEKIYIEDYKRLWLDELMIEASYIAAGLVAACQCPVYLAEFYGKTIINNIPGVAYRLCDGEHNIKTMTQMFREVTGYSDELSSQINRLGHGIVFAPYKNRVIAVTDRAYSYKTSTQDYIANIQTLTYMERIIRYESQDYKEHLIKEFFQRRPGSIISQWKEHSDCINSILKKDEEIDYFISEKDSTCRFEIGFRERKMEDIVKMSR